MTPVDDWQERHLLLYYKYNCFTALWILSGTTRVSRYQKGKTKSNLDFHYCTL